MYQEDVMRRIRTFLARFQAEVEVDNSNGEFSINIHAENVLLKVLNVAYGLNLENPKLSYLRLVFRYYLRNRTSFGGVSEEQGRKEVQA